MLVTRHFLALVSSALLLSFPNFALASKKKDPFAKCDKPHRHLTHFDNPFKQKAASTLPHRRPYEFTDGGLRMIDIAPVDFDNFNGRKIVQLDGKHVVGAIGGIMNEKAVAENSSVGFIAVKDKSNTYKFNLKSFDFFCLDRYHNSANCSIGVAPTKQGEGARPSLDRILVHDFLASGYYPEHLQKVTFSPGTANDLTLAAIGRNVATLKDLNTYFKDELDEFFDNNKVDTDATPYILREKESEWASKYMKYLYSDDLNPDGITAYIDNLEYEVYSCKAMKTPPDMFNGFLQHEVIAWPTMRGVASSMQSPVGIVVFAFALGFAALLM